MSEIDVLKAKVEQDYLIGHGERISMDPELALAEGVSVTQQVRVGVKNKNKPSVAYGIFTVYALMDDGTDNNDVRMAYDGRQRLNESDSFDGILSGTGSVVVHDENEAWLNDHDEFGEFLEETDDEHDEVVFCAPHGGVIENKTDEMAKWAHDILVGQSKDSSCWRCIGHQDEVGAYDAWHITSTEISRDSFPYLDQVGDRDFSYAVSFHGYGEDDIAIGGGAPLALKNEIKAAIEAVSGLTYDVVIVSSGPYAGVDPDNFVNWLTASGGGGVQIELPYGARVNFGQDIAEVVAAVFAAKQ